MKIHFISPYSYDLQIGTALNEAIAPIPDDSWIVHCDQDTLKPPGFAERIREVLKDIKDKETVLTCMTNRVGVKTPSLLVPDMYMEESISEHLKRSKELWKTFKTRVQDTDLAPGYCMIFHKWHWIALGGFPAHFIRFDAWLSERSKPKVMRGVYIIHLYRWKNVRSVAQNRYSHLIQPGYLINK